MLFIIHLQDTLHSLTIVLGRSGIDNILITRNGHKQQAVWCYLDSPNKLRGSSTPQLTSLLCIVVVSSLDVGFCFLSFSFCLACEWHFSIVYIEASPGPGLFYAPDRRMAVIPCNWATLIANLLVPVAILVFSTGFFPYKPLLPGLATFEEANGDNRPPAVFDKVVFMVVDALRRYSCFCVRNICI